MRFPWQPPKEDAEQRLTRLYGESAGEEWQQVRRALSLRQDFRLVILLVPDDDAASLCKLAALALSGPRSLLDWPLLGPEQLYELPARLARVRIADPGQVLWVQAVLPQTHAGKPAWERAWAEAAARLNERRDVLRAQIRGTLILCGAPWIVPVLRDAAPDLWSVRTLVARIGQGVAAKAEVGGARDPQTEALSVLDKLLHPARDSIWRFARLAEIGRPIALYSDLLTPAVITEVAADLDPQLALNRALSLRAATTARSQFELAHLLLRAAYGFALHRNAHETERLAGEVWALSQEPSLVGAPRFALSSQSLALRAWARLLAQHPADAAACAERALSDATSILKEPADVPPNRARKPTDRQAPDVYPELDLQSAQKQALRLAGNVMWLARLLLKDQEGAEAAYQAWQVHEGRDPRIEHARGLRLQALAEHMADKDLNAAAHLERALRLQEEAAAPPIDRAHTLGMLAACSLSRKDQEGAERYAQRALLLYEAEPDGEEIPLARGFVHRLLADSLFQQQRFRECQHHAEQAIALLAATDAPFDALYRARLLTALVPTMLGQPEKSAEALPQLLRDLMKRDATPENLERQGTVAELAHASLLWVGRHAQGLALLQEVEARLEQGKADPTLRARIAARLRLMRRWRWLVPFLGPYARMRLWLYRLGLSLLPHDKPPLR